jgi:hypothetical protein
MLSSGLQIGNLARLSRAGGGGPLMFSDDFETGDMSMW